MGFKCPFGEHDGKGMIDVLPSSLIDSNASLR
jgi:hypothetical protein